MQVDHPRIVGIHQETAREEILPLWRNLEEPHIELKRKDDAVAVADRACEAALEQRLTGLLPDSVFVGEEGVHADPSK